MDSKGESKVANSNSEGSIAGKRKHTKNLNALPHGQECGQGGKDRIYGEAAKGLSAEKKGILRLRSKHLSTSPGKELSETSLRDRIEKLQESQLKGSQPMRKGRQTSLERGGPKRPSIPCQNKSLLLGEARKESRIIRLGHKWDITSAKHAKGLTRPRVDIRKEMGAGGAGPGGGV